MLDEFDLIGYLESLGGKHSEGGSGPQMVLPCPQCGKAVLYVNVDEDAPGFGYWICYKCRDDGIGGAGRGVVSLIAWLDEISYSDARMKMLDEAGIDFGIGVENWGQAPTGNNTPSVETESVLDERNLPITMTKICLPGRSPEIMMPKYLETRGVTVAQARRYGIGFCEGGKTRAERRYSDRIVFPIECPMGRSFTARTVHDGVQPPYLAGPRAGSLVYGWPQARDRLLETADGLLVLCEGPFDVLAIDRAGVPAIGVMSKHVGEGELEMARAAGGTKLILMLDEDALGDVVKNVRHGDDLRVVERIPGAGDPGAATVEQILEALIAAEPIARVWARWMKARLKALQNR